MTIIPKKPYLLITGYPNTGKTRLSDVLSLIGDLSVFHTDSIIGTKTYAQQADTIGGMLDDALYDIYEGCAVTLGLLEWLDRHPREAPCEVLVLLTSPRAPLEPSAARFLKYLSPRLDKLAILMHSIPETLILRG